MVCWEVADVTCIVEVLILLLWLLIIDVSVAIEHAITLVLAIRVHLIAVLALRRHLAAKEIWVDLLVWINAILLILVWLLHLIVHLVHLLVVHWRIWVFHLVWLLLGLVLVVIVFGVHCCKLFKNYIS